MKRHAHIYFVPTIRILDRPKSGAGNFRNIDQIGTALKVDTKCLHGRGEG